jgi:hypothetical protein
MDEDRNRDPAEGSLEDEGIPDHGGPAPGKQGTGDQQEGLLPPGDEPRAVESFGTTADEQREGEPLEERLEDEVPDGNPAEPPHMGRLVEPGSGITDREKNEVAEEAKNDRAGLTAEEEAMQEEEEPGGLTDGPDQYVEEDTT